MGQCVELRVSQDGEEILVYMLKSAKAAAEMIDFLDGMLNDPSFVVQPLRH